jgi:peptidoglycan/xylan/chitin deacetylase (PgdA/CDA1 family)
MYHRMAHIDFIDNRADDWNVTAKVFACHMRTLANMADTVSLHELRHRLTSPSSSSRPLVCVTVDDGYTSALRTALPILVEYGIPATFFVPTAYIGSREPMPFDRWGSLNRDRVAADTWAATDWNELARAVATGLVTVGSHSHRHFEGGGCSPGQLVEEVERSREQLRARLGPEHARAYAYPYGSSRLGDVPDAYEAAVRAAGYELAVTTDVGRARPTDNRFRLPRIEALQIDSARVLGAKVQGSLTPYWFADWLRDSID